MRRPNAARPGRVFQCRGAALALAGLVGTAAPIAADWLVLTDGTRIETAGPWSERGRLVVFTTAAGALASVRRDEVDLEASAAATLEAARSPEAVAPAPAPARAPALVITDRDVAAGGPAVTGSAALVEHLRALHGLGDVDGALALVHWEGAADGVRAAMRRSFAFMMARPLIGIDLVPASAEEREIVEVEGRRYRPNLPIAGKLYVALEPIEEDADADTVSATFLVGEVLGTFRIAAAEAADER